MFSQHFRTRRKCQNLVQRLLTRHQKQPLAQRARMGCQDCYRRPVESELIPKKPPLGLWTGNYSRNVGLYALCPTIAFCPKCVVGKPCQISQSSETHIGNDRCKAIAEHTLANDLAMSHSLASLRCASRLTEARKTGRLFRLCPGCALRWGVRRAFDKKMLRPTKEPGVGEVCTPTTPGVTFRLLPTTVL